jgi:alanine dehydrogenase
MLIGVPKEIKPQENRVGLNPDSVKEMVAHGHQLIVETNAGQGILASDDDYRAAGAEIVGTAKEVFDRAEMIVKVKEPQAIECEMLREGQILFTYLHLAADSAQAQWLMKSGCVAIAYETVTGRMGGLPLLAPMSEVAGRMGPQMAAFYAQKHLGGTGRLTSGVPGVEPADVTVIGGGVSGLNAARVAVGMGARVTIMERSPDRIRFLDEYFGTSANVVMSNTASLERYVLNSDVVVGAVLIPGAAAPKLITKEHLSQMRTGCVVVDIAIDQGGCLETSRPTTHSDPIYTIDGVVHYCVANMPGAFPQTSTAALNHATLPYALELANKGWKQALMDNPYLREGLNVLGGQITYRAVAEALNLEYQDAETAMAA